MENKSHALAAGAFVLLVAALLVAMVMWLTRDKTDKQEYELLTRDAVSGLQSQAGVRYKGVMVGRVNLIELDPDAKGQIRIRIAVDKNTPITTSTFASLGYQGVTGLSFIQLDDTGASQQSLVTDGDHPARIPLRAGLVSRLTEQGGNLLEKADQIAQNVNTLLDPANQKILMSSIKELGDAAARIRQLAQQTEQVNLSRLAAQAETTMKSMYASSERMGQGMEAVRLSADEFKRTNSRMNGPGGTLDKLEQSSDVMQFTAQSIHSNLMPHINRTADNSVYAVRQLSRVADEVSTSPQLLIWGKDAPQPGPGENGFVP